MPNPRNPLSFLLQGPTVRPNTRAGRWLAPCLALSLSGCLGDQFGGFGETDYGCVEKERRELSLEETTPLGFGAEDILGFAATNFEVPLGWSIPEGYSGLTLTPAAGDTTLHLEIAKRGARATYVVQMVRNQQAGPNPTLDRNVECPSYLEIETELELRSDNGAFDDTLPITLQAYDVANATAIVPLESGKMTGSFELEVTGDLEDDLLERQPTSWKHSRTELNLTLSPGRVHGAMVDSYTIFWDNDLVPAASGLDVAFGRLEGEEPCYEEDFGGGLDEGEAISRLLGRLSGLSRVGFDFEGDTPDLELELSMDASRFCLSSAEPFQTTSLAFDADVVLTRPDGDVFANWPLRGLSFYETDGTFDHIELFFDAPLGNPFPIADAVSSIGDFGVDFGNAEFVALQVELRKDESSNWSGKLTLETANSRDPAELECDAEPQFDQNGDALGCPGPLTDYEVVAEAEISSLSE
jgi:hypothetical protein